MMSSCWSLCLSSKILLSIPVFLEICAVWFSCSSTNLPQDMVFAWPRAWPWPIYCPRFINLVLLFLGASYIVMWYTGQKLPGCEKFIEYVGVINFPQPENAFARREWFSFQSTQASAQVGLYQYRVWHNLPPASINDEQQPRRPATRSSNQIWCPSPLFIVVAS